MKTNVTYHPDHLGSNSFVTNVSGIAIQELRYMPYGEILSNKRSTGSNYNTPYKFSAKEKDAETGFNYHGARYYIDYMYVWMSPDPLSDEYPSTSPYMYVRGNPVRLIDPNGMWDTDYGITSSGELRQIGAKNNQPDRLYAINDDGTKKSNDYITLGKGTVSSLMFGKYKSDVDGPLKQAVGVFVQGDNNSDDIFKFVSENTNVEIGKTAIGNKEGYSGLNVITTSRERDEDGGSGIVAKYCLDNGISIRGNDHSQSVSGHPSGMNYDSKTGKGSGDIQFADKIQEKNPNAVFRIYTPSNKEYHHYNRFGPTLQPVKIRPK